MSSALRKIQANNFLRVLKRNPQVLTCNSYLNFLRYFKTEHPRYGLRKLLQNGAKVWSNLTPRARKEFKQKKSESFEDRRPRLKWKAKPGLRKVPGRRITRSYKKRHLSAAENIKRRKRNKKRLQRSGGKKFPGHFN